MGPTGKSGHRELHRWQRAFGGEVHARIYPCSSVSIRD